VIGTWAASMVAALSASVGRPRWWAMALAAFLIRGGILVVLLPLVSLPSAPSMATLLAPAVEALAIGRQSFETSLLGTALIAIVLGVLAIALFTGTWLDNALAREAQGAAELDLRVPDVAPSAWRTLGIRVLAHLPTLVVLGYAAVRLVIVTYQELLSPGDPLVPLALRVLARAPDAVLLVGVVWLIGEAIGGLAARRAAEGEAVGRSMRGAIRDMLHRRGAATFVVTDAAVVGAVLLLIAVVGRAADHVRAYLFDRVDDVSLAAALLLLVTTWGLALALLGAALAWRSTAWTIEVAPRRPLATEPVLDDDAAAATGEAAAG
jgi:hypothetical protein